MTSGMGINEAITVVKEGVYCQFLFIFYTLVLSVLLWFLIYLLQAFGLEVHQLVTFSPLHIQVLYQVLLPSSLPWLSRLGYISTLVLWTFWAALFFVVGVSSLHYGLVGSIPDLSFLDVVSIYHSCDNQKSLLALSNVPWVQNYPGFKTTDVG